jgi:DNA-directed RNA polymerase specialized sigma24 family protein
MFEQEPDGDNQAAYATVVDALRRRYDWRLIDREAFIAGLGPHAAAGEFRDLNAAAFNLYTLALHRACSGAEGAERQEIAYGELGRLLYDIASRRFGERSPGIVDETLGDIFEHFAACRKPGAFVAFAKQRLRNHLKRRWSDRLVSLDELDGSSGEGEGGDELDRVLTRELRERVAEARRLFLDRHKGARLQFEAVWMKFVLDLDDATIASRLGKEPQQVYVLRSRGLKKLRCDPAWRALADDLGFPPA